MAEQSYNLKYTGKEIDDLLDKANDMNSSAQVPTGGTSGQVLTKKSGTDYDAEWKTPGSSLPSGGTPSQVLTKKSTAAGDAEWRDVPVQLPPGGSAGQILQKKSSTRNDAGWVDMPSSENPLPTGGSSGQILAKKSDTNFDTEWINAPSGGGLTKKVLWENSNEKSTFNPQIVNLTDNVNNYELIIIEYSKNNNSTYILSQVLSNEFVDQSIMLYFYGGYRYGNFSNGTSIFFSPATNIETGTTDNNMLIPLKIIAYK